MKSKRLSGVPTILSVVVSRSSFDDARSRDLMRLKASMQSLREVDELLNWLKPFHSQKPKEQKNAPLGRATCGDQEFPNYQQSRS